MKLQQLFWLLRKLVNSQVTEKHFVEYFHAYCCLICESNNSLSDPHASLYSPPV